MYLPVFGSGICDVPVLPATSYPGMAYNLPVPFWPLITFFNSLRVFLAVSALMGLPAIFVLVSVSSPVFGSLTLETT